MSDYVMFYLSDAEAVYTNGSDVWKVTHFPNGFVICRRAVLFPGAHNHTQFRVAGCHLPTAAFLAARNEINKRL